MLFDLSEFTFLDPSGEVQCDSMTQGQALEALFECTMFSSNSATNLTVEVANYGLSGTSVDFSVMNGDSRSLRSRRTRVEGRCWKVH